MGRFGVGLAGRGNPLRRFGSLRHGLNAARPAPTYAVQGRGLTADHKTVYSDMVRENAMLRFNQVRLLFVLSSLLALPAPAQQSADSPLALELGATAKVTLDQDESAYFKVALPAEEIRLVLDTRTADDRAHNLQSGLSILDPDGGVLQSNAISFNEIDVCWRRVGYLALKKPATRGFKVTNRNAKANFWLTVSKRSGLPLVPLYGNVVPTPTVVGDGKTAQLAEGEDAFYVTVLPRGEYKVIAELTNARRQNSNIQGYVAFLDGDGGNQEALIGFNEIDVSFRKTSAFTVKKDNTFIIRVHNSGSASMNSLVRISPAE